MPRYAFCWMQFYSEHNERSVAVSFSSFFYTNFLAREKNVFPCSFAGEGGGAGGIDRFCEI